MELERVIRSRLVSMMIVFDVGSWLRGLILCIGDCLGLHFN